MKNIIYCYILSGIKFSSPEKAKDNTLNTVVDFLQLYKKCKTKNNYKIVFVLNTDKIVFETIADLDCIVERICNLCEIEVYIKTTSIELLSIFRFAKKVFWPEDSYIIVKGFILKAGFLTKIDIPSKIKINEYKIGIFKDSYFATNNETKEYYKNLFNRVQSSSIEKLGNSNFVKPNYSELIKREGIFSPDTILNGEKLSFRKYMISNGNMKNVMVTKISMLSCRIKDIISPKTEIIDLTGTLSKNTTIVAKMLGYHNYMPLLKAVKSKMLVIAVNCNGGSIDAAISLKNQLKALSKNTKIAIYIYGKCLSSALLLLDTETTSVYFSKNATLGAFGIKSYQIDYSGILKKDAEDVYSNRYYDNSQLTYCKMTEHQRNCTNWLLQKSYCKLCNNYSFKNIPLDTFSDGKLLCSNEVIENPMTLLEILEKYGNLNIRLIKGKSSYKERLFKTMLTWLSG